MKGSLDTNLVIRLIANDIPSQAKLVKDLLHNSTDEYFVADMVFVEVEYALRVHYELNRGQIAEIFTAFVSNPTIKCNLEMMRNLLPLYVKHPALSFVDIMLVTSAEQSDCLPLWTFDKKLATQIPGARILTKIN